MCSTLLPVFLVTHPRSRSTAFERMFFTRDDEFNCLLEIFQYPFYYGPERLGLRFRNDDEARLKAGEGYENATYKWAIDQITDNNKNGKRAFVKDMAKMIMPQDGSPARIAPSLSEYSEKCDGIRQNPTVFPIPVLRQLQFTFLIRDPRYSIPSLYRLTQPPMSSKTHWHGFNPIDAGYAELRALFEFLIAENIIGPEVTSEEDSQTDSPVTASSSETSDSKGEIASQPICVVDSDTLVHDPERILSAYCRAIGCDFNSSMLHWGDGTDRERVNKHYLVEQGFHDNVLSSDSFGKGIGNHANANESPCDMDMFESLWIEEFGPEGASVIRKCVEDNVEHYNFLKGFAIK